MKRTSAVHVVVMTCALTTVSLGQTLPTLTPISQRAIATLKVPDFPDFLAVDGDAVWVTNEGRIEKFRADQERPLASVSVPAPCGAMVVAFESVWVANCKDSSLYRIDRRTSAVLEVIRTGLADQDGELSLAAGAGSIWLLTDRSGILSRIDPRTNRVTSTVRVEPNSFAAAFGFDAVWVTNTGTSDTQGPGSVQRIDPRTNTVTATIPVGPTPRFLAAGEGGVWTLNQGDGTVTRIDPRTNTMAATIPVGVAGPGGDIAAGAGHVWVRATKVLLSMIDPETNRVTARFGPPAGSGGVRVGEGVVWVTAHDTNTVWALRP